MAHQLTAPLGGGVQPRLEINTFVQNDRMFSLYVQALNEMEQLDQSQLPSWFQVAGIHGLPFIEYDGSVGDNGFVADPQNQWAGYCTHGSTLFPTWHRPYVMLVEQIINHHAQQIAGTYKTYDRREWVDAATKLRQPYWDWAENIVPPPQVISLDQVEITAPNGRRKNVTNPLRRYTFHPIDPSFPLPYSRWQTTLRQPSRTGPNAKDNVTLLVNTLSNSQRSTTSDTFSMLTRIRDWNHFSNHDPTFGSANSLESIHDNIHVLVGGNGDMSDPAVAAFDPIFFLHHANVDRLLSLWSAINPGVWVSPGNAGAGTYTLAFNQSVNAQTPLTPFWKTQSRFWLSNQVTDTSPLGYTYPEFQGLSGNKQALQKAIARKVTNLYGPGSAPMSRRSIEGDIVNNQKRDQQLIQRANPLTKLLDGGKYSDWTARVVFDRSEVGHSFSVILFLGDVPGDSTEWLTCQQFVGAHHAFVNGMPCASCSSKSMEEGFVSLNPYIAGSSNLSSFEAGVVAPLLTQGLQWRVLRTDGQAVDVKSLQVTILEVPLQLLPGAFLPTVGEVVTWSNITQGRTGGQPN